MRKQCVPGLSSVGGGGRGPGDEASEKRYQALSRFTILEARKSWVGPGTKAN